MTVMSVGSSSTCAFQTDVSICQTCRWQLVREERSCGQTFAADRADCVPCSVNSFESVESQKSNTTGNTSTLVCVQTGRHWGCSLMNVFIGTPGICVSLRAAPLRAHFKTTRLQFLLRICCLYRNLIISCYKWMEQQGLCVVLFQLWAETLVYNLASLIAFHLALQRQQRPPVM